GRTLVSCAGDEPLRVWDVATGKEAAPLKEPPTAATLLALDRAGTRLAVKGSDGSLNLWDLRSGQRVRELHGPEESGGELFTGGTGTLAFSPDGKDLVATRVEPGKDEPGRSVLQVWDTASGKKRLTVPGPKNANGAFTPAFAPEGKI